MVMIILIAPYLLDLYKWEISLCKCTLADLVQLASSLQYLDFSNCSLAKQMAEDTVFVTVFSWDLGDNKSEEPNGEMDWFFFTW